LALTLVTPLRLNLMEKAHTRSVVTLATPRHNT
jgi:hypothetical protein